MVCRMHTALLVSGTSLQEGGGTNALLPTHDFPFLSPSPFYSLFCTLHSLGLYDMAFNSGHFQVMWHRQLLLAVGDVADVICLHPSMRGGAVVMMWQMQGPSKGGDMATVGDSNVVWLVGISLGDEHALA